jgi:outer membrane lipoprotein SlyB
MANMPFMTAQHQSAQATISTALYELQLHRRPERFGNSGSHAEPRGDRTDLGEEAERRDARASFARVAATILKLVELIQERRVNMLTRFIQRLGLCMTLYLLATAAGGVVMAEAAAYADEGKVEAIEVFYSATDNKAINGGTVIGGVAGGVIGHQIGSGRGKTAATIAGALGGAVVGNEIEKKRGQPQPRYRISVRLDSGSSLIVEEARDLNLRVGDRVRIEDGHIHRI